MPFPATLKSGTSAKTRKVAVDTGCAGDNTEGTDDNGPVTERPQAGNDACEVSLCEFRGGMTPDEII